MIQSDIHDKESKRKMEKDTGCKNFEKIDRRLPLQDARFDRYKTDNQTWGLGHFKGPHLRISPSNSPKRITTIPSFRVPKQPLHILSNAIWNQTLTNILCNSNVTNNNKQYLTNMTQKVIDTLKYFGFTMNMEKSEIEPNQTVIFLGWEWNLANATVKTKSKKRLLLLRDLYNMRRWIKTGIEITVKQTAKLIGKLNYLRLQFQEASLFLNTMDHQKAQAARLRGWNTTMIMNKTAIPDIDWWIAKLRANIPAQLIQILPQMTMTTDAEPSGWGSTLEKELEMIAMAHGTWNKRQAKLSSNNREIKAITQSLRSFAKTLKNQRVQSLAIRSDNSTAVFDFKKWRASTSLIKEIKQVHQTIEKLGIQIQITHLLGVRNEIADALSRLSREGDYKLKKKIFRQACLQMNLNPTIDLFSQHFNNLLPRFMLTIRGHGEIATDALYQSWKKELPWIHPPIPLHPAVLKKIREEQIEAMVIAPLWPGQIWYIELVNEKAQSLMLVWSNENLEPGTSLNKKNLKLPTWKICCFLMDRRPGKEEDL
ncbi:MAG: putative Transposon Tf2-6 polyprotein [Streblomastix strix]|uniref:Putative Transposon Tf2-6 polyprotein n=1 Tax=Streblomastix strix TaxID=222440 RepID=A0A5J4WUN3_9EUKA|nr:MAG: putative Transposon Tf2-6 polyprotein [Streblomastix strix]